MSQAGSRQDELPDLGWLGRVLAWLPFGPRSTVVTRPGTRISFSLHTLAWLGLCAVMGYAGAVQANGAAYLLAFSTLALGALSYAYARANLRGLEVRVGASPLYQSGLGEVLPVELRAATGMTPCGLEILVIGAAKSTFVEQIPSGQSVRLQLRLPASAGPVKLLLRSAYPLGLLRAQRVVNVELTRRALPQASGNLPLPQPLSQPTNTAAGRSGAQSIPSREGDDFGGLREWQPGDSPKHIDWRAVARGRPLLVKTWTRGVNETVPMDWEALPLPVGERAGQLVRWIQMCEQQGHAYSLKLPSQTIPAGQGEAHARRCFAALAEIHTGGLSAAETTRPVKVPASHEHRAGVPRGPLALLSAVLFFIALPLQDLVALPVLLLLFLSLSYRSLLTQPVKHRWLPLAVIVIGIAGVYFSQGDLMSMEAGIAVLVVLTGGKMLESRTPHDFQVIAIIGWFLCLCGLMADQSITRSLLMFTAYILIAGCMVRFRRGVPGVWVPARLTGRILLQALPLVVLLFLTFPRVSLDYLVRLGSGRTAVTGVPSSLDPGKVLQVARSTETAFRVEFPDGNMPPNNQRYWRCVVLWDCQGLSWSRGLTLSYAPSGNRERQGQDIRQIITLEPHGQYWLPGLDYPLRGSGGGTGYQLSSERVLNSHDTVRKMRQIEIHSRPQLTWEPLPDFQRNAALRVPVLSASLRQLAQGWREGAANDTEVVQAGLNYLRTQGFEYTLEPGSYLGPTALEDFFLRRRVGFCEHFSASFATLMRAAGVPSRVVMGYLGGELSMTGTHMIVRQSDAHSWAEVWLDGAGWMRVDPTAALAPGRLDLGLQSFLGGEEALERQRNSFLWRSMEQARQVWEQVNYQWYKMIINFDGESQFGWLSWLGASGLKKSYLLIISAFLVVLMAGIMGLWLRRPARQTDPWQQTWRRFCRHLESLGLPARRENEGPLAYAQRLSGSKPEVVALAQQYASARYGAQGSSPKSFEKAWRALR